VAIPNCDLAIPQKQKLCFPNKKNYKFYIEVKVKNMTVPLLTVSQESFGIAKYWVRFFFTILVIRVLSMLEDEIEV
jgi:hypothetical protein